MSYEDEVRYQCANDMCYKFKLCYVISLLIGPPFCDGPREACKLSGE